MNRDSFTKEGHTFTIRIVERLLILTFGGWVNQRWYKCIVSDWGIDQVLFFFSINYLAQPVTRWIPFGTKRIDRSARKYKKNFRSFVPLHLPIIFRFEGIILRNNERQMRNKKYWFYYNIYWMSVAFHGFQIFCGQCYVPSAYQMVSVTLAFYLFLEN